MADVSEYMRIGWGFVKARWNRELKAKLTANTIDLLKDRAVRSERC